MDRKSHLFDGKTLHRDVGNFQVCDISDPLLSSLIHDPRALSTELDVSLAERVGPA